MGKMQRKKQEGTSEVSATRMQLLAQHSVQAQQLQQSTQHLPESHQQRQMKALPPAFSGKALMHQQQQTALVLHQQQVCMAAAHEQQVTQWRHAQIAHSAYSAQWQAAQMQYEAQWKAAQMQYVAQAQAP